MSREELLIQIDLLKRNINRMMISDDIREIGEMYYQANKIVSMVFIENIERTIREEEIRNQILEEAAELEEEYDTDISDCVVNCSTCKNHHANIPHTCDICTSLDQDEDYGMWEAKE